MFTNVSTSSRDLPKHTTGAGNSWYLEKQNHRRTIIHGYYTLQPPKRGLPPDLGYSGRQGLRSLLARQSRALNGASAEMVSIYEPSGNQTPVVYERIFGLMILDLILHPDGGPRESPHFYGTGHIPRSFKCAVDSLNLRDVPTGGRPVRGGALSWTKQVGDWSVWGRESTVTSGMPFTQDIWKS